MSQLIRISAAQGLEIPYVGFVELSIQLFGHVFENMGFLIVKDPVGTTLSERKKLVPGVIGSNIFRDVREVLSAGEETMCENWRQLGHIHGHMY